MKVDEVTSLSAHTGTKVLYWRPSGSARTRLFMMATDEQMLSHLAGRRVPQGEFASNPMRDGKIAASCLRVACVVS